MMKKSTRLLLAIDICHHLLDIFICHLKIQRSYHQNVPNAKLFSLHSADNFLNKIDSAFDAIYLQRYRISSTNTHFRKPQSVFALYQLPIIKQLPTATFVKKISQIRHHRQIEKLSKQKKKNNVLQSECHC